MDELNTTAKNKMKVYSPASESSSAEEWTSKRQQKQPTVKSF